MVQERMAEKEIRQIEWLSDGVLLGVCISERQYDGYHSEVYPFANQRRKKRLSDGTEQVTKKKT